MLKLDMKDLLLGLMGWLGKPFIGSGITSRMPFLYSIYFYIYPKLVGKAQKVFDIPLGKKLKAYLGDANTGIFLSLKGEYEPTETDLFLRIIEKGDILIDIGANIGYYTVLGSELVGPKGKVISFEPDARVLPLLRENIELNKASNIEVVEKALGDKEGKVNLVSDETHMGLSGVRKDEEGVEVNMMRLSDWLDSKKLSPSVIKMDIEGAEVAALRGLGKVSRCKLLVEINKKTLKEFGEKPESLIKQIQTCGFSIEKIVDETTGKLLPYSEAKLEEVFGRVHYTNLYCVA